MRPRDVLRRLCRFHDGEGAVVGTGFVVAERLVLSCAHVIEQVFLDKSLAEDVETCGAEGEGEGEDYVGRWLELSIPALRPNKLEAEVIAYCPIDPDNQASLSDIALLQLAEAVGLSPLILEDVDSFDDIGVKVPGFSQGRIHSRMLSAVVGEADARDWVALRRQEDSSEHLMGLSGSPVFSPEHKAVLGMTTLADLHGSTLMMISSRVLLENFPQLRQEQTRHLRRQRRRHYLKRSALFVNVLLLFTLLGLAYWGGGRWLSWQARVANSQQQTAKAIALAQSAIRLRPRDALLHYNLASWLEGAGLSDEQVYRLYERAGLLDEGLYLAHNTAAQYILRYAYASEEEALRKLELALQGLKEAQSQGEVSAEDYQYTRSRALKNRGWANYLLGFEQQAESDLRAAIALRHDNGSARCLLALLFERQGKESQAEWFACYQYARGDTAAKREWVQRAQEVLGY